MAESTPLHPGRPLTLEEFYALPEDGWKHELQAGIVVSEPPAGFRHGQMVLRIGSLLQQYVREHDLGVATGESGYLLADSPVTVRGPDIAYVSKSRLAGIDDPVTAFPGAPDLVIEVLSPSNTPTATHAKVADYLAAGTRLVWVVDCDSRTVTEYQKLLEPHRLGVDDRLDGRDVVPGFCVAVADVFRDL